MSNRQYLSKRRKKIERDQKYRCHLKILAEHSARWCSSPAACVDEIYVRGKGWVENPKPYYKRYYRGQRSKYLKRMSHKVVRRYQGELSVRGNMSNKIWDFWWNYT